MELDMPKKILILFMIYKKNLSIILIVNIVSDKFKFYLYFTDQHS